MLARKLIFYSEVFTYSTNIWNVSSQMHRGGGYDTGLSPHDPIHVVMLQNVSAVSGCGYSTVPDLYITSCRGGTIHEANEMKHISIHYCNTMHVSSS